MLPELYRLKRRRDFARAYDKGKAKGCSAFVLYRSCRKKTELERGNGRGGAEPVRIGFSASKKLGKAVVRNRLKRVFRAAAAAEIECFIPGYDYIFVIRRPALESNYEQIKAQMAKILAQFH